MAKLTIFVRADLTSIAKNYPNPATDWVGAAFDGGTPMGGWNLTAAQAADESALIKTAVDAYQAYTEFEVQYPNGRPVVGAVTPAPEPAAPVIIPTRAGMNETATDDVQGTVQGGGGGGPLEPL